MSLRCPIPGRDPALFPHSHLPSLGGRFSGRGGFPLEIGSLRFDGRLGGRLCGLSLRRSGRRGPDRGILNLVAAIAVCLAALGGIPELPPQPLDAVLQPAPGQLLGRRLYLLLELLLYRGFFFYRFNGVSPPAKRGQGPGGPRPFYIIPPHLLRRASYS